MSGAWSNVLIWPTVEVPVSGTQWKGERTDQDSLVVALLARLADLHRALGAGHHPPLRLALHGAQVYQVSKEPLHLPVTLPYHLLHSSHSAHTFLPSNSVTRLTGKDPGTGRSPSKKSQTPSPPRRNTPGNLRARRMTPKPPSPRCSAGSDRLIMGDFKTLRRSGRVVCDPFGPVSFESVRDQLGCV
jgi:hypothetical protein